MRIIGISVEFPFNSKMKQVHLELLLCLLLAISATGQYHSNNVLGHRLAGQQFGVGQTDLSGYGIFSDPNSFGNYGQQPNNRLSSLSRTNDAPSANKEVSQPVSNFQGIQRDQTYDSSSNTGQQTIDGNNKYARPYAEPTGPPFGIQSTGYVLSYPQEKLDLSKCGPQPTTNPCKTSGPQYHALSGYPHCYIHCSFGRIFIKPCPIDLIWNTRINSCDWPTIGSTVDTDDYAATSYDNIKSKSGSQSYDTLNNNYGYSYGRKKRSIIERKKRNLGGFEAYYRSFMTPPPSQNPYAGYYGAPSYKPGPLQIPLTAYNLPGPVGYAGQVGFAGVPSQYAGVQSLPQAMTQPVAPTLQATNSFVPALPSPVPQSPTPTTSDSNAQARSNLQFSGLYADSYGTPARNVQAAPPTDQTTAPETAATASSPQAPAIVPAVPTAATNGLQAPPTFFPGFFPPTFFPQQNVAPVNPFVSRTPMPLEVTLIPGPFYPYGPPHGGPFGGPMPPTPPTPPTPKPSLQDYFKYYRYFGGQYPSPHGFFQSQTPSPAMPSGGQPFSNFRSFAGQSVPTGFSYGGQYPSAGSLFGGQSLSNGFSYGGQSAPSGFSYGGQSAPNGFSYGGQSAPNGFSYGGQSAQSGFSYGGQSAPSGLSYGGQTFQGFMPVNGQQYPTAMPYGGRPLSPFRKFSIPIRGGKQSISGQRGRVFDIDIVIPDHVLNGAQEEEDEDIPIKGERKVTGKGSKNNGQTTGNKNSEKSNSNDDKDDDANSLIRKKRQYDAYAKTVGQAPAVGGTEPQQYPASFNPFRVGSYDTVQQSRFNSNQYVRPSISRLSPCVGKSPGSNTAHPTDDTKYIGCVNKFYYETMNCPLGLIYNAATDRCEKKKNPEAICDREQPCMNGGQCYQTGPTAYKCTCNGAWTGERCETQLSSCANNPCGPGNICQTVKTGDYKQDYVCVCDENQSYGSSCGRNAVPNPCLTTTTIPEQYHPFAFSAQAFIQCNGDLLYVQPCAPGLIWNKDEKVCDRPETTSDDGSSQSYETVYGTNEQQLPSTRFGPIFADQAIVKPQTNQQRTILVQQKQQSNINSFKQKPSLVTNNNNEIAQEQPILTDRSSSSTPLTQTETINTYVKRPMYDDVYYEPTQMQVLSQQPLQSFSRFRLELPQNINTQ